VYVFIERKQRFEVMSEFGKKTDEIGREEPSEEAGVNSAQA
jgi:hypothetical protein